MRGWRIQRFLDKCRDILNEVLELLSSVHGLRCDVSCEELLEYLRGPTYEDDTTTVEEVFDNYLLILHEIAEICILKSWGYEIGRETVERAYPDTYSAHLKAMDIELSEALRRGELKHVEKRCRDLSTYLDDPHLPPDLASEVRRLIAKYCETRRSADV